MIDVTELHNRFFFHRRFHPRSIRRRLSAAAAAVLCMGFAAVVYDGAAHGADANCHGAGSHRTPREQDTVWLIDTRGIACQESSAVDPTAQLAYRRYDRERRWQASTGDAFFATDAPEVITCVYVHGNRLDASRALRRGWDVYRSLARGAPDGEPIRFVIWSWPSAQIRGQLRDVRVKAARSDTNAYYFGRFLSQIDPEVRLSLLGFSYGARIITGGLQLTGGGTVLGHRLEGEATPRRPIRLVLLAAGLDNRWILPGGRHERALSQAERTLLLYNSCDPVLKRFRLLSRCDRAEALGYTGLVCDEQLGEALKRIEQMDVCCLFGKSHNAERYIFSGAVMSRARPFVFWQSLDAP